MSREWRFLQMLKRSGRGHESGGTENIPAGACALLCPTCPQPGINLPRDNSWQDAPPNERYLYSLFLAIDANFKMKRKQVSSEDADPGLNQGAAFFSDVAPYMAHVQEHWGLEQEVSLDIASYDAWLTMITEKYINMDYMLLKSLSPSPYANLIDIIISYDIACQWSKNLWFRVAKYRPELQDAAKLPSRRRYVFLIPKFHLPAHIERCNIDYSFDLTPNVGRTDGEAPERGWANANPLASSTREMGPGSRRDTIDDHFNDWNHKKSAWANHYSKK
ncbi:CxC2 domain-containing protein [Mycena indigotica]|uniref:CxC2 domain-containing protein n=1 Tax=Mycena indigotica TaxID=2126181 RepID=A0A8H6SQA2_9AGAR|nr:CxC2 domain-containing protein [Mycena indigotica]KAF7303546.1 CxC2 domain-containing protein [Mycena indigotica]